MVINNSATLRLQRFSGASHLARCHLHCQCLLATDPRRAAERPSAGPRLPKPEHDLRGWSHTLFDHSGPQRPLAPNSAGVGVTAVAIAAREARFRSTPQKAKLLITASKNAVSRPQ